jgi:MFS family permease
MLVFLFFIAYYAAYEPYRALYPDLLESEVAGRGQSTQALFRGAATGVALVGGGLLFGISPRLPFLIFAVLALVAVAEFIRTTLDGKAAREQGERRGRGARETLAKILALLRENRSLRAFFVANALWELALAALKTFVILWLTRGLGIKLADAALAVGAVALFVLAGAAISGKLADKFGRRRIMLIAMLVFGFGLIIPTVTTFKPVLVAAVPFIAFGGGVLLSLPYALLQPLMPKRHHGALTGYYSASRGLGVMLGPLLAGGAISLFGPLFRSTQGYAATWGVCSLAILASVPLLLRMGDGDADGAE